MHRSSRVSYFIFRCLYFILWNRRVEKMHGLVSFKDKEIEVNSINFHEIPRIDILFGSAHTTNHYIIDNWYSQPNKVETTLTSSLRLFPLNRDLDNSMVDHHWIQVRLIAVAPRTTAVCRRVSTDAAAGQSLRFLHRWICPLRRLWLVVMLSAMMAQLLLLLSNVCKYFKGTRTARITNLSRNSHTTIKFYYNSVSWPHPATDATYLSPLPHDCWPRNFLLCCLDCYLTLSLLHVPDFRLRLRFLRNSQSLHHSRKKDFLVRDPGTVTDVLGLWSEMTFHWSCCCHCWYCYCCCCSCSLQLKEIHNQRQFLFLVSRRRWNNYFRWNPSKQEVEMS